ncbi:MAG: HAD-IIB family hydrolase [Oscillospiraceae bacterium]|nr:HAD-IIB family hydrolase [Oscillospiraceae bacterium]
MKKFSGMLLASDFDGTLADSNGQIPSFVREKIKYFISEGGYFTVCTGRTKQGFHLYNSSIINAPVLLANGIMAYDYKKEKTVFSYSIDKKNAAIASLIQERFPDVCVELYSDTFKTFAININDRTVDHFSRQYIDWANVSDLSKADPPFVKIMVSAGVQRAREVQNFLDGVIGDFDLKYIPSSWEYVEIINKDYDKGKGLMKLADILGADKNKVFAVGDGENDLDMLKAAFLSFVPANGCEAAKSIPHIDVPSNDNGAVAAVIDYLDICLK